MIFPKANEVTIKSNNPLSTLLNICLKERTLKNIIDATPKRADTTKGKISNAPIEITPKKTNKDLFANSLSNISDVAHSSGNKSLLVLKFFKASLLPWIRRVSPGSNGSSPKFLVIIFDLLCRPITIQSKAYIFNSIPD